MNDSDIKKYLDGHGTGMRPACDFWKDFRGRAAEIPQDRKEARRPRLRSPWLVFGAPLTAVAATLAVMFVVAELPRTSESSSEIMSYQVSGEMKHSGVMILRDEESDAAILWIMDADDGDTDIS